MMEPSFQQKAIKETLQSQLRQLAKKLEAEYAISQTNLGNVQEENKALKESLKNITVEILEKLKKIETSQAITIDSKLKELKNEVDKLRTTLYDKLSPTFIHEDTEVKSKKQSLETLQGANLKLINEMENRSNEKKRLDDEINKLQEKISACRTQHAEIDATLSAKEAEHQKLTKELNSLTQFVGERTQETERLKVQISHSEKEILTRNNQLKEILAETNRLTNQSRLKEADLKKLDELRHEHQNRISVLESELRGLQAEQQKLIQSLAPLESQRTQYQKEKNELTELV